MSYQDYIDGELIGELTINNLSKIQWKTRTGEIYFIKDMDDKHIRNIALMMMGFGYRTFRAPDNVKIIWLRILKMEWDRRMLQKRNGMGKWTVRDKQLELSDCITK